MPKRTKQLWESLYPKASPQARDILGKMLTFNPNKRFTVEECLEHEYFEGLHNPDEEPFSDEIYDWSWDNFELKKETIQSMVYDEASSFAKH